MFHLVSNITVFEQITLQFGQSSFPSSMCFYAFTPANFLQKDSETPNDLKP
jgi:hypothetical protein